MSTESHNYLSLTMSGEPFENPRSLQALLHAAPWRELVERVFEGEDVPVSLDVWGVVPAVADLREFPHEPELAREYFARLAGEPVRLLVWPEDERLFHAAGELQSMLLEAGIDNLEIELAPGGDVARLADEFLGRPVLVLSRKYQPVEPPGVQIFPPQVGLFVGSYSRVPIRIDPQTGLGFDDLELVVPEGLRGGLVSPSRDRRFDPTRPEVMLLAGHEPGTYTLQAVVKATGAVVGSASFEVNLDWTDRRNGPSLWLNGEVEGYVQGAAWGGGPAGPQNLATKPAKGKRRIALLLVDTKDQRFPTSASSITSIKDRWLDETTRGVTSGGVTRSSAHYFREVSYNNFDLSAEAFGPIHLKKGWSDYFGLNGGLWASNLAFDQTCITEADKLIDYKKFDSVVLVVQGIPASGSIPAKRAWPFAWGGAYANQDGKKSIAMVHMDVDWGVGSNREIHETLSHELGHNLGLGDQYRPTVPMPNGPPAIRNIGGWGLMDEDDLLPHLTLVHRMILGWIPKSWIKTFDFATMGVPVQETVTLRPIEKGAPGSGSYAGIEVRVADGWNYYFEYRSAQTGQIGDRNLPANDRVVGTDVRPPKEAPIARPRVLLLANDPDGDGSVLGNTQDFTAKDTTNPLFPTTFTVAVSGIDGKKADVRVEYGVNSKPDPSIRPWPASAARRWQSPDIEVRNARNQADAKWKNVPWEGHPNTIVARVKNSGSLDAPKVRTNFFVKEFTVGGAPETYLGSDTHDVAAGKTEEFKATWTPPKKGHFCVIARIPLYQIAGTSVVEMTQLNNEAQSNYTRFISKSASPPSREISSLTVGNPLAEPARVAIIPSQSNPVYRTYLEHTALELGPGETREVEVMFEYAPDEIARLDLPDVPDAPNEVSFAGMIWDRRDPQSDAPSLLGGAQVQVVQGLATRFDGLDVGDGSINGQVVTEADGTPATGGKVLLVFAQAHGDPAAPPTREATVTDGRFGSDTPAQWDSVELHYLPADGYGDASLGPIARS